MDRKKKIIVVSIVILALILLGLASWFIYKTYIKDGNKDGGNKDDGNKDENLNLDSGTSTDSGSSTSGGTIFSSVPTNPFKSADELLKFQQWVVNVKGDKTILGTGGSTGYGDDGKWGRKSSTAWDKYKDEFYKWARTSGSSSNCPSGQIRNSITGVCEAKVVTPSGFKAGDSLLGRNIGKLMLYGLPSSDDSIGYINIETSSNCELKDYTTKVCNWIPIGTFISDSGEFVKIKLDKKIKWYESGLFGVGFTSKPKEVYVYKTSIKK